MPIDYRIEHDRRLVVAEGHGTVWADDILRYQREVWTRADVAAYDEIVDMSGVERNVEPSSDSMRSLADLSAQMDPPAARPGSRSWRRGTWRSAWGACTRPTAD